MTSLVMDTSVTMSWCFEDEVAAVAETVLDAVAGGGVILVPAIWPLEVANVLAVAERRGRLSPADSARFIELLGGLPIVVEETPFTRATGTVLATAREYGLSAYDASYLELAMRQGVPLASADGVLAKAAQSAGVNVL